MPKYEDEHYSFAFGRYIWDVTRAWRIVERDLAAAGRPRVEVSVAECRELLGMLHLDRERVMSDEIDLSVPLLLAPVRAPGDPAYQARTLVIDGWHRLAKAEYLGVQTLLGYPLSEVEAYACEEACDGASYKRVEREHRPCGTRLYLVTRRYKHRATGLADSRQFITDCDGLPVTHCPACNTVPVTRQLRTPYRVPRSATARLARKAS